MRIVLKRPIVNGSETISEFTMREEVTAGDLRGIKASALGDPTIDDLLKIAGRLCAQPDVVMNKLSPADMDSVLGAALDFFGSGPKTGPTP